MNSRAEAAAIKRESGDMADVCRFVGSVDPAIPPRRLNSAPASVIDLFTEQVRRIPDGIAVICGQRQLTYAALAAEAERVAHALQARGITAESRVGICAFKSAELVIGIVAVLRAGAAYVPLDPTYPPERLRETIRLSRLEVMLVDAGAAGHIATGDVPSIDIGEAANNPAAPQVIEAAIAPDNLALIVYTSGSTGRPKGVAITHRGILSRVAHGYRHRPGDVQKASIGTAAHVSDLLLPLVQGGTVRLLAEEQAKDVGALARALASHGATRVVFVPPQLQLLVDSGAEVLRLLTRLDTIVLSGDVLTPGLVRACGERCPWITLVNAYGATESTSLATSAVVKSADDITVGRPLSGAQVHVLDDDMNDVPIGEMGEIWIGGERLARGYLDVPSLTADRFRPNPFGHGERLYRTGDLGRWEPNGALQWLGRRDRQVKVNGFVVALGEVEAKLELDEAVARAAVVAVESKHVAQQLAAYVVPRRSDACGGVTAIRERLAALVPAYMVPAVLVSRPELPYLPNGKIDYCRLQDEAKAHAAAVAAEHRIERTFATTADAVAATWCEVLGVPSVAASDNFLALGGDSMLGGRVVLMLSTSCGVDLSLADLWTHPTAEQLARVIDERQHLHGV